jgi:hypothetical protein
LISERDRRGKKEEDDEKVMLAWRIQAGPGLLLMRKCPPYRYITVPRYRDTDSKQSNLIIANQDTTTRKR